MGSDIIRHVGYGQRYQGISNTPAVARSRTGLCSGLGSYLYAWRWRPGFLIDSTTTQANFMGQNILELPSPGWTGPSLDPVVLGVDISHISGGVNNTALKRFMNVDITMDCVPDPATSTFIGGVPNPGTGTSEHQIKGVSNAFVPSVSFPVNGATMGSGTEPPATSAFPVYAVSDSIVVNVNTSTESKVTYTLNYGWTGDGGAGTIYYTKTLVGRWYNGTLPSDMQTDAWAIFQSIVSLITSQGGVNGAIVGFTRDSSGAIIQNDNTWGGSGGIYDPGDNTPPNGSWTYPTMAEGINNPFGAYGYYTMDQTSVNLGKREAHFFMAKDFIPIGPFYRSTTGTFSWRFKKLSITPAGVQTFIGNVSAPTLWANDRFLGQPDGTGTLYVIDGDTSAFPDVGGVNPFIHF